MGEEMTTEPEIDVEQIMASIQQSAARHRGAAETWPRASDFISLAHSQADAVDYPQMFPAPAAEDLRPGNDFHVFELLRFEDIDFIRNAYRAILAREADPPGLQQYLCELWSGRHKIEILESLRSSPEGRAAGVRVRGLWIRSHARNLLRLPVFGYFARLLSSIVRLPVLVQEQRVRSASLAAQQRLVTQRLERAIGEQNKGIAERFRDAAFETDTRLEENAARLAREAARIEKEIAAWSEGHARSIAEIALSVDRLRAAIAQGERRVTVLSSQLDASRGGTGLGAASATHANGDRISQENGHRFDALYAIIEDAFRGPEAEVKKRLGFYLPLLQRAGIRAGVLDVGCGRGEWLEILKEGNIEARGVDFNRVFVEECHRKGMVVEEKDALSYLRQQAVDSFTAITAFHVVEHLAFETLIDFFDEVTRVLKPGGIALFETPNPANLLVASCNFYTDPTHQRPIPSHTLKFLLESRGLHEVRILDPRPHEARAGSRESDLAQRLDDMFSASPDYGIIGLKP